MLIEAAGWHAVVTIERDRAEHRPWNAVTAAEEARAVAEHARAVAEHAGRVKDEFLATLSLMVYAIGGTDQSNALQVADPLDQTG